MPRPDSAIAAVVLAAGAGSRMGENKMLLPWKGIPILAHVVEAALGAASLHSVTVVLGADSDRVADALHAHFGSVPRFTTIHNPDWREGQSTSLRRGLSGVLARPDSNRVEAVMFLLGDLPRIRAGTIDRLAAAHAAASKQNAVLATAPTYNRRRGNPAILSRALFPRIDGLRGDTGARGILRDVGDGLRLLPVDDPGVCRDIDTIDAYNELRNGNDSGGYTG